MNSSFPQGGSQTESSQSPAIHIDTGKRLVALIIDVLTGYFLGAIVSFLPFISQFLPSSVVVVLFLLTRDFFFEGRGVGKNLMGLRVVDVRTQQGPTITQSVQRNLIFFAPSVVAYVMGVLLAFIPFPWINQAMQQVLNIVCMAYVAIVIPMECWRVWQSKDGRRIGDEIAGTCLVEANMDFSNAFKS